MMLLKIHLLETPQIAGVPRLKFNVTAATGPDQSFYSRKNGGGFPYVLWRSQFTADLLPSMKTEICEFEAEPGTKIRSRQACANRLYSARSRLQTGATLHAARSHRPLHTYLQPVF